MSPGQRICRVPMGRRRNPYESLGMVNCRHSFPPELITSSFFVDLQFIRISTTVVGVICFLVTIGTFKNVALKYDNPIGLWITYLIYPAVCVVIYTVSQLILVIRTLDDRWAIGHIVSAVLLVASDFVLANQTGLVALRPRLLCYRRCLATCVLQHNL